MPHTTQNKTSAVKANHSAVRGSVIAPDKSLLDRLLEIKNWIGLGVVVVTAVISSGGWILTYFAKKEEVETLSCTMDVNVRLAKGTSSMQLIRERQFQLRRSLREMAKQGVKGGKGSKASAVDDDDEYSSAEELKTAIKTTKDNLQILAEDSTFFLNSLARKECDSKEGRDKLREKLRAEPPLKGG